MNENAPHDSASGSSENPKAERTLRTPNPKVDAKPADLDDPGIGAIPKPPDPPALPPHESLWPERWRTIRSVSGIIAIVVFVLLLISAPIALVVWMFVKVSEKFVFPPSSVSLNRHWKLSGGLVVVAVIRKLTFAPRLTDWFVGCLEMTG